MITLRHVKPTRHEVAHFQVDGIPLALGHAEGELLGVVGGAVGFLGDGIEVDAHVGCGIDVEMQIGHVRHVERLIVAAILEAEPVERGVTIRLIASSERLQAGPRLLIPGSKRPVGGHRGICVTENRLHICCVFGGNWRRWDDGGGRERLAGHLSSLAEQDRHHTLRGQRDGHRVSAVGHRHGHAAGAAIIQDDRRRAVGVTESAIVKPRLRIVVGGDAHGSRPCHTRHVGDDVIKRIVSERSVIAVVDVYRAITGLAAAVEIGLHISVEHEVPYHHRTAITLHTTERQLVHVADQSGAEHAAIIPFADRGFREHQIFVGELFVHLVQHIGFAPIIMECRTSHEVGT